jgi:hypothetical protein
LLTVRGAQVQVVASGPSCTDPPPPVDIPSNVPTDAITVCQDDRGLRVTVPAFEKWGVRMGMRLARRLATTGIAAMAVVALTAGPASAHFCFKTQLNERAAEGQAGSANWVSFHDLAFEFTGLCDEGIQILAEAGGVTPDTLINGHGTMAGGTLRKGEDAGTKSISHLDFAAIEAARPAAEAACEG